MNFYKQTYFLFFQKYLKPYDLINDLELNINDILEITKKFFRVYTLNQKEYFKRYFLENTIILKEIEEAIIKTKNSKDIVNISRIFNIENRDFLINIYNISKKNYNVYLKIIENDELYNNIKKNNINNNINKEVYIDPILYRDFSVEEISLKLNISPQKIEDISIELGVGSYWNNENIRIGSLSFTNYLKSTFSISEIIYLINNMESKDLEMKMNSSKKSINILLDRFHSLNLSKIDIINSLKIKSKDINNLLDIDKDRTEKIRDFKALDLFNALEIKHIEDNANIFIQNILNNIRKDYK
jgi:hypothetical protein